MARKKRWRARDGKRRSVPDDLEWYAKRGLLDMEVKERPPLPDVWPPPLASYAWRGAAKIDYGRRILRGQTMDEQEAIHEGYIYDYIRTKEDKS